MTESRRERKKRLTRQRIVMSAIRLFERQGYEQTTVAQIASAADVDPKTFFNYFRTKDEVLFVDLENDYEVLLGAISARRPGENPGEVLARAITEFAAHRRTKVPAKRPEELSAVTRLAMTTPALQAKGLYLLLDLQQRIADELYEAFGGRLDRITSAAMTGSLIGAIQQASLASLRLGRSQRDPHRQEADHQQSAVPAPPASEATTQPELWQAAERGLEIAMDGLRSVRPATESPTSRTRTDTSERTTPR